MNRFEARIYPLFQGQDIPESGDKDRGYSEELIPV